jgi:hypothetical protein
MRTLLAMHADAGRLETISKYAAEIPSPSRWSWLVSPHQLFESSLVSPLDTWTDLNDFFSSTKPKFSPVFHRMRLSSELMESYRAYWYSNMRSLEGKVLLSLSWSWFIFFRMCSESETARLAFISPAFEINLFKYQVPFSPSPSRVFSINNLREASTLFPSHRSSFNFKGLKCRLLSPYFRWFWPMLYQLNQPLRRVSSIICIIPDECSHWTLLFPQSLVKPSQSSLRPTHQSSQSSAGSTSVFGLKLLHNCSLQSSLGESLAIFFCWEKNILNKRNQLFPNRTTTEPLVLRGVLTFFSEVSVTTATTTTESMTFTPGPSWVRLLLLMYHCQSHTNSPVLFSLQHHCQHDYFHCLSWQLGKHHLLRETKCCAYVSPYRWWVESWEATTGHD